jgi:hypothetical protein
MTAMGHKQISHRHLGSVRFTPQSGHRELASTRPFSAKSRLTHRSKQSLFDHLVGAGENRRTGTVAYRPLSGSASHLT